MKGGDRGATTAEVTVPRWLSKLEDGLRGEHPGSVALEAKPDEPPEVHGCNPH